MTTHHKSPTKCVTKFCRGDRHPRGGGLCGKCVMRRWRKANRIKATLAQLRDRAVKKKVPFDLTLEWLTNFLTAGGYDSSLHHIDRKMTWLGYTMDNLQILPISENIAKGNRERWGQAQIPF